MLGYTRSPNNMLLLLTISVVKLLERSGGGVCLTTSSMQSTSTPESNICIMPSRNGRQNSPTCGLGKTVLEDTEMLLRINSGHVLWKRHVRLLGVIQSDSAVVAAGLGFAGGDLGGVAIV